MARQAAAVQYDPTTGKFYVQKGSHWVELDNTQVSGLKVARGVHQQVAASDTVLTGLALVVAVVVSLRDTPTAKQMFFTGSIGTQAGAPAAGSILIKSFKPTAVNDVTPIAATDFTDNLSTNWIAVGTA